MKFPIESRKAAAIVGVPERQFRYWATAGLISPEVEAVGKPGIRRKYSLGNLFEAVVIRELDKFHIPTTIAKKALVELKKVNFSDGDLCWLLVAGDEIKASRNANDEELQTFNALSREWQDFNKLLEAHKEITFKASLGQQMLSFEKPSALMVQVHKLVWEIEWKIERAGE